MHSNFTCNCNKFTSVYYNTEKEYVSLFVAPKSDSVATQVINDFRNNRYEIYKTEIINSDTTYYYRLKQKEQ